MSRHLKTRIISGLKNSIARFVTLPANSAPRARGVRYFKPTTLYEAYWGAMNSVKEGYKYHKHIIVRRAPEHNGYLQLYTYHFPKTWSAACIANRELIKEAQRRAHVLERDHSLASLEWRIRFFRHYFRVIRGGFDPEPGFKRYARFYQYVYVAIYRDLKAAQQSKTTSDDMSFTPVEQRPLQADTIRRSPRPLSLHPNAAHRAFIHPPLGMSSGTIDLLRSSIPKLIALFCK